MANYYTHFCLQIAKASKAEIEFWKKYGETEEEDDDGNTVTNGFEISIETENVYVSDDGDSGNVDHATLALRRFLTAFPARAPLALAFANTCDKHRPDAFDGGVVVVWPRKEVWLNATSAGIAIAAGKPVEPMVVEFSDPLEELRESTGS